MHREHVLAAGIGVVDEDRGDHEADPQEKAGDDAVLHCHVARSEMGDRARQHEGHDHQRDERDDERRGERWPRPARPPPATASTGSCSRRRPRRRPPRPRSGWRDSSCRQMPWSGSRQQRAAGRKWQCLGALRSCRPAAPAASTRRLLRPDLSTPICQEFDLPPHARRCPSMTDDRVVADDAHLDVGEVDRLVDGLLAGDDPDEVCLVLDRAAGTAIAQLIGDQSVELDWSAASIAAVRAATACRTAASSVDFGMDARACRDDSECAGGGENTTRDTHGCSLPRSF